MTIDGPLRAIEEHHIDIIPDSERHGRVWHQFTLRAGGNTNVFNVVLGGVVVSFGLSFYWAIIAIGVGTGIGALLIALHATQGPRRPSAPPSPRLAQVGKRDVGVA